MSGYLGFENDYKNNQFLQFILSDKNIEFIKKQTEYFLRDAHPDKLQVVLPKKLIYDYIIRIYYSKLHVSIGDIHSRFHQCNDMFQNRLKELNNIVMKQIIETVKLDIDEQTRYRGFSVWKADMMTRNNNSIKLNRKKKNSFSIESRY